MRRVSGPLQVTNFVEHSNSTVNRSSSKQQHEKTILLYYDPVFLKHDTGNHPESAARLFPTIRHLDSLASDNGYSRPNWEPITRERLLYVHTAAHIDRLRGFAAAGGGAINPDTVLCPESFDVALMAAGAVGDAVQRVDQNEHQRAFCLVRPPGHHAATDQVAGFCLFNNVAIGARIAARELGYQRVLIVDWDVHHGDGTQAIFWEDPQVAYFSIHRSPFYPFTGYPTETGVGAGKGTIRNIPIEFGTARQDQIDLFDQELSAFAEAIEPQLVMISAGFDAHKNDPIGSLGLESVDFGSLTRKVVDVANRFADGKIVSVLEGGYDPPALAECVEQHLERLTVKP